MLEGQKGMVAVTQVKLKMGNGEFSRQKYR